MGLGDLVSKVLVEFKADTSDLKKKIKDLQGTEKERAKQLLSDIEKTNKGYESTIEKLAHLGLALDVVGKVTDTVKDAFKSYGEEMRLQAAAAGVNIGRLEDAFGGLVTRMDTLKFAAQAQHGALKLTQDQMDLVGKATVALTRAGFDQEEVFKKLTEAAVRAKTEGLDDLGLAIKDGATPTETLTNIMDGLRVKIAQVGDQAETSADKIKKIGVAWDNLKQDAKDFLAESFTGGGLNYFTGVGQLNDAAITKTAELSNAIRDKQLLAGGYDDILSGNNVLPPDLFAAEGGPFDQGAFLTFSNGIIDKLKKRADAKKRAEEMAKKIAEERKKLASDVAKTLTDDLLANLEAEASNGATALNNDAFKSQYDKLRDSFGRMTAQLAGGTHEQQYEAFRAKKEQSFLESTFGTLDEFDAYATAFQTLTGAVSAGLNAWIDGSASAGEAIKKFLADALKGLATQMAVEALKHGAYALGSLAFGDVRGAGQHAAAAAAFGAAAAAAAVGAKSLGGGGAQASGGGAGTGGASAGGTGSGAGGPGTVTRNVTNYVIVGDSQADNSPRMQQRNFQRQLALAESKTSVTRAE